MTSEPTPDPSGSVGSGSHSDTPRYEQIETNETVWLIDREFMASNWECIWGRGCLGILAEPALELNQGCCSVGAHLDGEEEAATVSGLAATLDPARFQFHREAAEGEGDFDRGYGIRLLAEKPFIRAAFEAEGSDFPIDSYLPGRHNFQNIKTAIAIGKYFKVPPAKIVRAIATYLPSNNRSQWLQQGTNSVLLDAYNANPTSMSHALQAFAGSPGERRVAILGEMLELGAESAAEHRKVLEYARSLPEIDQVLTVGAGFAEASRALAIPHFPDLLELQRWLEDHPVEGASVLLKASRGVGLERILPYL